MTNSEKPRIARLTAILTQLQAKQLVTATYLAEKHKVSIRTIYRDIRTLTESGIPIRVIEGKGYSLVDGYQPPPVMFTEEEANALITAEQLISKNKDESLVDHYHDAIEKIQSVLKYSQKEKTELLAQRIVIRTNIQNDKSSNYLMRLQSAITKFNLIDITYESLQQEITRRTVEPFAVYSTQENWLLIAFCRLRKEFRVFRIDQIQQLSISHDCFEPHAMTLDEYFELCRKKYLDTPDTPLS